MDALPSLPPYAHLDQEAVQCIAQASSRYGVPELLMHAVLVKENGRSGRCSKNSNGTYDCGLAQINTAWAAHFGRYGIEYAHIAHNPCLNIQASAYILRHNFNLKQSQWFNAIVAYNIGPNKWTQGRYAVGYRYAADVVARWWGFQRWVEANRQQPQVYEAPLEAVSDSPK